MHDDETTKRDEKEGELRTKKHVQTFHLEDNDQNKNKKFMETLRQHIKI